MGALKEEKFDNFLNFVGQCTKLTAVRRPFITEFLYK